MAIERMRERSDGRTDDRIVERDDETVYVDRGGSGIGDVILGIAVLALVAIIAFFLLDQSRNDELRTSAVTNAASSVSHAARNVGDAAQGAADSANR